MFGSDAACSNNSAGKGIHAPPPGLQGSGLHAAGSVLPRQPVSQLHDTPQVGASADCPSSAVEPRLTRSLPLYRRLVLQSEAVFRAYKLQYALNGGTLTFVGDSISSQVRLL